MTEILGEVPNIFFQSIYIITTPSGPKYKTYLLNLSILMMLVKLVDLTCFFPKHPNHNT